MCIYSLQYIYIMQCTVLQTFCCFLSRRLVQDPRVKLKYQHLITNSFVEVSVSVSASVGATEFMLTENIIEQKLWLILESY